MKPVSTIVVIFLLLISVMHLLRILFEFQVTVAGAVIPMWISLAGCIFTALLAGLLWHESRRR
jgi:hypothetical protein